MINFFGNINNSSAVCHFSSWFAFNFKEISKNVKFMIIHLLFFIFLKLTTNHVKIPLGRPSICPSSPLLPTYLLSLFKENLKVISNHDKMMAKKSKKIKEIFSSKYRGISTHTYMTPTYVISKIKIYMIYIIINI